MNAHYPLCVSPLGPDSEVEAEGRREKERERKVRARLPKRGRKRWRESKWGAKRRCRGIEKEVERERRKEEN